MHIKTVTHCNANRVTGKLAPCSDDRPCLMILELLPPAQDDKRLLLATRPWDPVNCPDLNPMRSVMQKLKRKAGFLFGGSVSYLSLHLQSGPHHSCHPNPGMELDAEPPSEPLLW